MKIEDDKEKEELQNIQNIQNIQDNKEKSSESLINLNFLKSNENEQRNILEESKQESKQIENTKDLEKPEVNTTQTQTPTINLNFLKSDDKIEESKNSILNINLLEEEKQNQELSPKKKTKIIKQIKNDISEIDKSQKEEEYVINDALKSILKVEEKDNNDSKENITIEQKQHISIPSSKDIVDDKKTDFDFLPNINISLDEKKEILKDFINDASYNLKLIQKYLSSNDLNSINFLAIKIKSSAEILNLTDITKNLEKIIANHSNIENIQKQCNKLAKKIDLLKQYL